MKAYKIVSSLSNWDGNGDRYNPYGEWKTNSKEFYHLTEESARKHIAQYITECAHHGVYMNVRTTMNKGKWTAKSDKTGTVYTVDLMEIDIKD